MRNIVGQFNMPPQFLTGGISIETIGFQLLMTIIFFFIARRIFMVGVRKYHSANG